MEGARLEDLPEGVMARVSPAVYCAMAAVGAQNRPRLRLLHPICAGPIGWVISWPESHNAKHLARNPAVSLAYVANRDKPVYVDAVAEWIDAAEEKWRIWELYKLTPPPLGFDPQPHYGSIDHRYFGLLR